MLSTSTIPSVSVIHSFVWPEAEKDLPPPLGSPSIVPCCPKVYDTDDNEDEIETSSIEDDDDDDESDPPSKEVLAVLYISH